MELAFTSTRANDRFEIHRMGIDGTGTVRLTDEEGRSASWSPDGTRIVFESVRNGNSEIYVMNADGMGVTGTRRLASLWPNGGRNAGLGAVARA